MCSARSRQPFTGRRHRSGQFRCHLPSISQLICFDRGGFLNMEYMFLNSDRVVASFFLNASWTKSLCYGRKMPCQPSDARYNNRQVRFLTHRLQIRYSFIAIAHFLCGRFFVMDPLVNEHQAPAGSAAQSPAQNSANALTASAE